MIEIDGSIGEGGGQVLRTSLTLSVILGEAFRLRNIRAGRKVPGLRPQHLKAVEAASKISDGYTVGAEIGSQELEFVPGDLKPGRYETNIGTAGSTSLVFQTIFLPLSILKSDSSVVITGGTHVPWSPSYHYLDFQWLKWMSELGIKASLTMEKAGFYPQGGGVIKSIIKPVEKILPLNLLERGELIQIRGLSGVANLPRKIAERQRNQVLQRIGSKYPLNDIRNVNMASSYKGTILLLLAEFEFSQACYFGLGAIGKPAEKVADEAIDYLLEFLETNGVFDHFLADQIMLPLVFAGESSKYFTPKITDHLVTNAAIIKRFIEVDIIISGKTGESGTVFINTSHQLPREFAS
jgi:RNA 3'-terminal phosphate cyclase (ATP)